MNYAAVIFDLDGTLLDTLDDLADSCNRVLSDAGLPTHPVDRYRYFVGDGLATLIRRILPEDLRSEDQITELGEAFRKDYGRNWKVKTRPYGGIDGLFDVIRQKKLSMNVLSNKPHEFTVVCVQSFFSTRSFDVVLGHKEGGAKKPDPAGALEIARTLQVSPADVLYVGDTATDMQTARAAGMYPIGALWGFRTEEELRLSGAELLVGKPLELAGWLSEQM